MKILLKFGGVCLKKREDFQRAANIIEEYVRLKDKVIVVTSAPSNFTDKLIETASQAKKREEVTSRFTTQLESYYLKLAEENLSRETLDEVKKRIQGEISELSNVLSSISYLGELTPRTMDLTLSYTEALPTILLEAALRERKILTKSFLRGDAGIVTDENFGNASPLQKVTAQKVRDKLLPLLGNEVVPIVAGFTANTQDELITTLGRGGSDYTGTLIGSSLKVDEIIIWTDVDGFMTADPKVEPEAVQLPSLSYEEASEMVYFGVKSMHPHALTPALEMRIPLRIRNFFNLENEGTLIQDKAKSQMTVRALSIIRDVCLFTVSGTGLGGTPGNTAKIFSLLGQKNIDVLMISQGSSQATISFIIPKQYLERAYSILEVSLLGTGLIKGLNYEDNVCIIAVIGGGMKGTPGVAARIFKSVAETDVNVRMIAQGSSELNVSFVVKAEVGEKTIRALHKEFRLGAGMNSNLNLNS